MTDQYKITCIKCGKEDYPSNMVQEEDFWICPECDEEYPLAQ